MSFPLFIAKRHLFNRHKIGYISFISIVSTIGLALGVAALILTISVLNGFENVIKEKLIGFDAHIRLRLFNGQIFKSSDKIADQLLQIPEVKELVPYVHSTVMIRNKAETDGVILEGIKETDIGKTLDIHRFLKEGSVSFQTRDGGNGIIIGRKLAAKLDAKLGDNVYLFVLEPSPQSRRRPKVGSFTITGIYESGIADYDDIFVYTSLGAAQDMMNLGDSFSGFQMILDNPYNAAAVADTINTRLGYPYHAMSWLDLHANLFEWLRVQRFPIIIVFGLIAAVAIFNIVSSLMMIVIEKTKDIGILKSMGISNRQTGRIFLIEGTIIGIAGTFSGYLLAFLLSWLQNRFGIIALPEDVYFMNQLPIEPKLIYYLAVGFFAILSSILATIYPSHKAMKLAPTEAIRYE
ncbi:MAG: ABC transporter permease [Candidatus Marinimicrobia bacterium]|nr:ABC transporter permease [Candidatus Neomarinimicrobiota bacterium]